MKATPYALVTVRMPLDLHDVLEAIAVAKGETLSVVVRDLVRQAALDARHVNHGIPQIVAAGSAGRCPLKSNRDETFAPARATPAARLLRALSPTISEQP